MPGAVRLPSFMRAQLPHWEYLGGEALAVATESDATATLPSTCTIVVVRARGVALYYALNNPIVGAASPGYVPANGGEVIGPLSNLNTLIFYNADAATAGTAHLQYFREV